MQPRDPFRLNASSLLDELNALVNSATAADIAGLRLFVCPYVCSSKSELLITGRMLTRTGGIESTLIRSPLLSETSWDAGVCSCI